MKLKAKTEVILRIIKTGIIAAGLIVMLWRSFQFSPVAAQDVEPSYPFYVIQEGDSLWDIASRFGVSIEELEQANNISSPDQISAGTRLIIPGLEGINGQLVTRTVPFGESLTTLSRRYQVPTDLLTRINRITSPADLYAGASMIFPAEKQDNFSGARVYLTSGQSFLEAAAMANTNPWMILVGNELRGSWDALPEEVVFVLGREGEGPGALPGAITAVTLEPTILYQGNTSVIQVNGPPGLILNGSLAGRELNIFPDKNGYVALQGIHALTEPGLYPLILKGTLPQGAPYNGQNFEFTQSVLIRSGNYPFDPSLEVNPETIDPTVTEPEDKLWKELGEPVTAQKMWDGLFQSPVPEQFKDCWTSLFGNRRSYNGGPYRSFHSGLDFCGRIGTELYAPAAGEVVYTGSLTVRGKVTVINHGWGIYTAYDHQSEIKVKVGDVVKPGQLIGLGGATGRTTGPHLHWEVWVGGVQVDPIDWLQKTYP